MRKGWAVRFDRIILKPLWLVLIILSCTYCFRQEWGVGLALVGMNLLIGVVASSLHKAASLSELMSGFLTTDSTASRGSHVPSDSSRAIAKASCGLGMVLGMASAILMVHYGIRLLWAVVLALVGVWVGTAAIAGVFGISEWIRSRGK